MLLMRDSDNPSAIPLAGLAAVGGYGDGVGLWSPAGWARFVSPVVPLVIVVNPLDSGDILDVERGAATVADAPGWYDRFSRPGRRLPSFYCSRDTISALRAALGPNRPFDWWCATLDGTMVVEGAVAVQYCGAADSSDPCRTSGHYDESVILDPSWIGESSVMVPMSQWEEPALIMAFQLIQTSMFGVIDPTGQAGFINAIRSGVTVNAIMDGWRGLPQCVAFQGALAELVTTTGKVDHLGSTTNPAVLAALQKLSSDSQTVLSDLQALVTAETT